MLWLHKTALSGVALYLEVTHTKAYVVPCRWVKHLESDVSVSVKNRDGFLVKFFQIWVLLYVINILLKVFDNGLGGEVLCPPGVVVLLGVVAHVAAHGLNLEVAFTALDIEAGEVVRIESYPRFLFLLARDNLVSRLLGGATTYMVGPGSLVVSLVFVFVSSLGSPDKHVSFGVVVVGPSVTVHHIHHH